MYWSKLQFQRMHKAIETRIFFVVIQILWSVNSTSKLYICIDVNTQVTFTCSKSTLEILENGVEFVQS